MGFVNFENVLVIFWLYIKSLNFLISLGLLYNLDVLYNLLLDVKVGKFILLFLFLKYLKFNVIEW